MSVVFWDFDETLAERKGRWWGCLLEIIEREYPGHAVDATALRQALQRGYPWHYPDVTHEHLNEPDAWWAAMQKVAYRCRNRGIVLAWQVDYSNRMAWRKFRARLGRILSE